MTAGYRELGSHGVTTAPWLLSTWRCRLKQRVYIAVATWSGGCRRFPVVVSRQSRFSVSWSRIVSTHKATMTPAVSNKDTINVINVIKNLKQLKCFQCSFNLISAAINVRRRSYFKLNTEVTQAHFYDSNNRTLTNALTSRPKLHAQFWMWFNIVF